MTSVEMKQSLIYYIHPKFLHWPLGAIFFRTLPFRDFVELDLSKIHRRKWFVLWFLAGANDLLYISRWDWSIDHKLVRRIVLHAAVQLEISSLGAMDVFVGENIYPIDPLLSKLSESQAKSYLIDQVGLDLDHHIQITLEEFIRDCILHK